MLRSKCHFLNRPSFLCTCTCIYTCMYMYIISVFLYFIWHDYVHVCIVPVFLYFIWHMYYTCVSVQLRIGSAGSCAEVGVVAMADLPRGTLLALIPRHCLLNASNSHRLGRALRGDRQFCRQLPRMNSWVPLLLALLAEYGRKASVVWHSPVAQTVVLLSFPQ